MKAHVILNQSAGTLVQHGDDITPHDLSAALAAVGIQASIERVTMRALDTIWREIIARRPDAVIVGGGDGTVSAVAGRLIDTAIPLGALPLGTFNHFAKDIGMPADWREAVAALAGATVRAVDLGEVNGRIFINNCSLGAYPEAVRQREAMRQRTGRGKIFAMFLAGWGVFRRMARMRLTVETDGERVGLRAPFVLIANNQYSGHVLDANLRERLDEGRLWLYTTRARRRTTMLRLIWHCLTRRLDAADGLERRPLTEAVIGRVRGDVPIALDGEPIELQPPFHFRIRPRALQVLSPRQPARA